MFHLQFEDINLDRNMRKNLLLFSFFLFFYPFKILVISQSDWNSLWKWR